MRFHDIGRLRRHRNWLFSIFLCAYGLSSSGSAWSQSIGSVKVFKQAATTSQNPTDKNQHFIIEIAGTSLRTASEVPRIVVFPATGIIGNVIVVSTEADTLIRAEFSAGPDYILNEVGLSYADNSTHVMQITAAPCNPKTDVKSSYLLVPEDQVGQKYGNGVEKNFDVFQLSIVSRCSLPIIVPLAGILISEQDSAPATNPFALEHVTSIYSMDRKLTGRRAIFFNILQAMATLGSAVEPFFGPGFTQGVSILGGGFTQAAETIFKDMSAEQLQNLTSQSFQNTEQIGPGGSLQKYLFLPKQNKKSTIKAAFAKGKILLTLEVIPTTASPTTNEATGHT